MTLISYQVILEIYILMSNQERSDELFGPTEVGKKAKNVQALYLMKSSGVAWQDMISTSLKYEMKFNICGANNDIWYKPSTH